MLMNRMVVAKEDDCFYKMQKCLESLPSARACVIGSRYASI